MIDKVNRIPYLKYPWDFISSSNSIGGISIQLCWSQTINYQYLVSLVYECRKNIIKPDIKNPGIYKEFLHLLGS